MGKFPLSFFSPATKTGEGERRLAGDGLAGGPGLGSGSGEGEEEEGSPWGRFPVAARPEAVWGGLATAAGGQQVAGSVGAALQSLSATRTRGKGKGSLGGSIAYLGLGWGAAGRGVPRWPASWGGGNGGRRRWELGRRLGAAVGGRGGKGQREGPFYRRNKAAGRAVGRSAGELHGRH